MTKWWSLAVVGVLVAGCTTSTRGTAVSTSGSDTPSPSPTSPSGGSFPSTSAGPSSSSSAPTTTATTAHSSPATTPAAAGAPPTSAALAAAVLHASDLQPGWTSTPAQSDPTQTSDQAALVRCVGGKNTDVDKVGDVNSPDFALRNVSVSSSASSYRTQADIQADIAILNSPRISACYNSLLKTQLAPSLPAGATIDSVSVKVTPGGTGGIVGRADGTINVSAAGQILKVYLVAAFITGRLSEAEVDIESSVGPIDPALFASTSHAVAARLAKL